MKKTISIIIALCLMVCVLFTGCKSVKTNGLSIDGRTWYLSAVLDTENDEVLVCGITEMDKYYELNGVDMTCTAKNGSFRIKNNDNGDVFGGDYTLESSTTDQTLYSIVMPSETGKDEGTAEVDLFTYEDGTSRYALTIAIGDYAYYFYANIDGSVPEIPDMTATAVPATEPAAE